MARLRRRTTTWEAFGAVELRAALDHLASPSTIVIERLGIADGAVADAEGVLQSRLARLFGRRRPRAVSGGR